MKLKGWFLKLEAAVLLIAVLFIYFKYYEYSWSWFLIGILIPDVSAIGFLVNEQVGNFVYNLGHTLLLAVPLLAVALMQQSDTLVMISLIWLSHIFMDRMFGVDLRG
ncbi:DUF4260 domain-containing protein [Pediococcus ethanolidurans]|uniref:DUF4260 domain-containing protein n=1 Tax=Pediococcus ethanolidurans TaxID=319653 RepID=UPI0021AAC362|nr:DUF4260 domain-containing protein [Pediococcus ethanolidurans]MCT4398097.1 DUF4260 family protein [Pediococcus ethanolidurans]MCV3322130.1 DUF4260 domain-containing protein [Pediococcus ethanolidurans]MCV3328197.1 DUF4260 domain-containing protein [Pediococcus ethanolidurans]